MCTTKALIEFLKQFPESTKVKVLSDCYYAGADWRNLDLASYSGSYYNAGDGTLFLGDRP